VREGTCYPANHVGAVIDRREDGEVAAAEMRSAGFSDVCLFHGEEAYASIRAATRHDNALTRAWRRLRDVGEEGEFHRHFLSALQQGNSILIAYAASAEQVDQARTILARHHAHGMHYLGAWTLERLAEPWPDQSKIDQSETQAANP
jgi:hypothetical protein